MNVRILDVFDNHAEQIEDRRALSLGICGAVMLWRTLAGADTATSFPWAEDSINTIAFTRKDTIGRSLS
jgi:hypothetical protein